MNRRLEKECESGLEYLLPDYMGDVKKLLMSRARIIPAGKFVSDGAVEVSGSVEYNIIYLDSLGKLTEVNASSDFSDVFAVDSDAYVDALEESRVGALKVRVTGPRKILLKADVRNILMVSEERDTTVDGNAFSEEGRAVEKCMGEISFASSVFERSAVTEYAEVLESFDDITYDGAEIICVNTSAKITETQVSSGEVSLKGEHTVSAVVVLPEGTPRAIRKSFPFEEKIALETAQEGMNALSSCDVCSSSVSLSADGEYMSAIANFSVQYSVELLQNKTVEVITDAYTPGCECKNKYTDTEFLEHIKAGREVFYVTLRCERTEERLEGLSEVVSLSGELRGISSQIVSEGAKISGDIIVNGLGYETNVDGSITYLPFKMQGSFEENVNIDCQIKDKTALLDAILSIEDLEAVNDGDYLSVRCAVSVKYHLSAAKCVRLLTYCEAVETEESESKKATVTVYYPRGGERLFDVAKKYKTTSLKIARDNDLSDQALSSFDSPDSLVGVKRLIIR